MRRALRRAQSYLLMSLLILMSGCFTTSITVRDPRDVAMVRAFHLDRSDAGARVLETYLKESARTDRFEAVGNTITDSITAICTAISPWCAINALASQISRAWIACNDAATFRWKITDGEDRIKLLSYEFGYDNNDRPSIRVTAEFYPLPVKP